MTSWTERLDRMIAGTFQRSPCGEALLLPLVREYRAGYVRSIHHVDERFLNVNGAVFGGYLAALFDHVSANTAMTMLPEDHTLATAQLSIHYFRPCLATDSPLDIQGLVVNHSRRSYHIEVTMGRADGTLVAKAYSVQAIFERSVRAGDPAAKDE